MTADPRTMSLGREGEEHWGRLSNALRLSSGRLRGLVLADKSDVRNEVRRRLEALASAVHRLEPELGVLERIHEVAQAGERDPLVWIEASAEAEDVETKWLEALRALNRGRDLIADHGEVSVVLAGPHWLHELVQRRAPDLSSMLAVTVPLDDTLEPLPKVQGPLCWMHLSDLHVLSEDWEQDVVLGALVRDLPGLLEQVDRRPQLLCVTGDLAARGDAKEYDGVFAVLEKIRAALGLARDRVFMVPGNHDVERSRISPTAKRHHEALLALGPDELRKEVGALLGDSEEFGVLYGRRLAEYCHFTKRFLGAARSVSFDEPWRTDVIDESGIPLGIASVCTAWSSGADNDKGRLLVGERQVRALVSDLEAGGAVLRVALLHHPLSWLCEAEERQLRAILRKEFDIVLHGHEHDSAADVVHRQTRGMVEIGAGAAYAGLGQDRYHGFWIGWLDPNRGRLELDAFTWDGRDGGRWRRDAGFIEDAPEGRLSLSLKLARVGAAPPKPDGHERVADALRRAVARVYASLSFIGLPDSAPKPKATIDSMFVPLSFARQEGERVRFPLRQLEPQWIRPAAEGEVAARVVILGAPGSGKSTLCRYLAVQAARTEGGPVPLLLTVRNWTAEGAWDSLLAEVARQAGATLSVRVDDSTLAALCEAGRTLLLIDGIDEVSSERRTWLRDCVHGFCESYPRVPVIVTSRVVGYDHAPLDREFEQFCIEPFDDEQLDQFIERWYELAQPDNPSERQRRSSGLRAALEAEPRVKALASTPLLATLIALVHLHQAHLPGQRARLFQLCIELLVVTWPAERGHALAELDGYWQIARLEELALWMQRRRTPDWDEPNILISGAELERRLEELLAKHRDDLDDGLRRSLAVKWRRWLVEASGLIQEFEHDQFGFVHLSLLEYLAGRGILRERSHKGFSEVAEFVVEHHELDEWVECLLLMLGSEDKNLELTTTVVERLLSHERSSWETWEFLVATLREEVELPTSIVVRILEGSAAAALSEPWLTLVDRSLADTLKFGRAHKETVREWFLRHFAESSGEVLAGVLLIAPESISPAVAMQARSDEELGLESLLNLPAGHWSRSWAYKRAREDTLLRWSCTTPIARVVDRSAFTLVEKGDARIWVVALLRRAAWGFEVLRQAAHELRHVERPGGRGLPSALEWRAGSTQGQVAIWPAYGASDSDCIEVHDTSQVSRSEPFMVPKQWADLGAITIGFVLTDDFSRDFPRELAEYFEPSWLQSLKRLFALHLPADLGGPIDSIRVEPIDAVGEDALPAAPSNDTKADVRLEYIAETHAGILVAPAFESPTIPSTLAAIRAQNCWLNLSFDDRVTSATDTLTPEQHALLLALGLAQYQTTHAWPDSDHWRSWFATNTPPEYWLAAYVWHLVRWMDDPTNPAHQAAAEAALERGDWLELVEELRKYRIRPTPPEVLALFDGGEA